MYIYMHSVFNDETGVNIVSKHQHYWELALDWCQKSTQQSAVHITTMTHARSMAHARSMGVYRKGDARPNTRIELEHLWGRQVTGFSINGETSYALFVVLLVYWVRRLVGVWADIAFNVLLAPLGRPSWREKLNLSNSVSFKYIYLGWG